MHSMDNAPRFTRDPDNRVTDSVSGLCTAPLTPEAAALLVKSGNAANAMMRATGSVGSTYEDGGYRVAVDRYTFHVTEV